MYNSVKVPDNDKLVNISVKVIQPCNRTSFIQGIIYSCCSHSLYEINFPLGEVDRLFKMV